MVRGLRGLSDQPKNWKKPVLRGLASLRDEADGHFRLLGGLSRRNLGRTFWIQDRAPLAVNAAQDGVARPG